MKKLFFLMIFCLLGASVFAQLVRSNNAFVRLNGTIDIYSSAHYSGKEMHKNGTSGFSLEFGGKHFLCEKWFFEHAVGFVLASLPIHEIYFGGKNDIVLTGGDYAREYGAKIHVVAGYNFSLRDNMSIDVFAGPDFRYLFKYSPSKDEGWSLPNDLRKTNFKIRTGLGLNYNNMNVILTVNPDLLDRAKGIKRYRTVRLGLGVGYYFR